LSCANNLPSLAQFLVHRHTLKIKAKSFFKRTHILLRCIRTRNHYLCTMAAPQNMSEW
jgi:hypothetical protein